MRNAYKILFGEILSGEATWENLGLDGKIIIKWTLKKQGMEFCHIAHYSVGDMLF
jgi:hypothetical protein